MRRLAGRDGVKGRRSVGEGGWEEGEGYRWEALGAAGGKVRLRLLHLTRAENWRET